MQPTASKTTLLLNCARPFEQDVEVEKDEPGEAAEYGTIWHATMHWLLFSPHPANLLKAAKTVTDGIERFPEVRASVMAAEKLLRAWLAGDNPWKEKFTIVSGEQPRAMQFYPGGRRARRTTLALDTHTYDLRPKDEGMGETTEIGGTEDLVVKSKNRRVVIDYKTGDYGAFDNPAALDQMLTLALMTRSTGAAILHAPRGLPPIIYADDIPPESLRQHSKQLRQALQRAGDGSMRPGKWCERCPAKVSCPAQDARLIRSATTLVKQVSALSTATPLERTAEDLGHFHLMLTELQRLAGRARDEIRMRVEAGEVIERPDGKTLVLIEKQYERLSKSSILEALGKEKGEKLLAQLREWGCLTTESRREMHAK